MIENEVVLYKWETGQDEAATAMDAYCLSTDSIVVILENILNLKLDMQPPFQGQLCWGKECGILLVLSFSRMHQFLNNVIMIYVDIISL